MVGPSDQMSVLDPTGVRVPGGQPITLKKMYKIGGHPSIYGDFFVFYCQSATSKNESFNTNRTKPIRPPVTGSPVGSRTECVQGQYIMILVKCESGKSGKIMLQ